MNDKKRRTKNRSTQDINRLKRRPKKGGRIAAARLGPMIGTVFIIVIAVWGGAIAFDKYMPTRETMDLREYYTYFYGDEVALIINDEKDYRFDVVVISTGGHASYNLIKRLGHTIILPKPSLIGLKTNFPTTELAGVTLKNIRAKI